MAKVGFWLKGSRGKLAGAVLQKSTVGTISRDNVTPRNPKTDPQKYQRAIMGTVMRAYSAGKEIFNHSFQGEVVGYGCQRKFIQENANLLRTALATDVINQPGDDERLNAIVGAKGVSTPVPNAYIISKGDLDVNFFTTAMNSATGYLNLQIPRAVEGETIGAYFERTGLKVGEIYTFCAFLDGSTSKVMWQSQLSDTDRAQLHKCVFAFVRLIAKAPATPAATAAGLTLSDIFEISYSANVSNFENLADMEILVGSAATAQASTLFEVNNNPGSAISSLGIIRSDKDQIYRSTSSMEFTQNLQDYGVSYEYLLEAWSDNKKPIGGSSLILEGGKVENF